MNDIFAPTPCQAGRPGTPARPVVDVSRRHFVLATLLGIVETWEERSRFRWQLAQMSKANPHLIDDIGLTTEQLEAEIGKPFWQA